MSELIIKGLVKKFDSVEAVKNVNLEVKLGEILTLLGPSGCGKTTTLRCIAGLEKPDKGEIYIGGVPVFSSEKNIFIPPEKRGLGMVFQSYAIWPHMTVYENIAYGLKERKMKKDRIKDRANKAIEMVKLEGLENRNATQISGGQQQRVALARAIAIQPKLLLLDEPLSNLDAKLRESTRFELIELQRKLGITSIYVTHDQTEAMVISHRIAIMDRGVIVQEGSPRDIYENPLNQFVADFVGVTNFIKGRVKNIGGGRVADILTEIGERFLCPIPEYINEGDDILLSLRPERINLSRSFPQDKKNVFKGKVKVSVFIGDHFEYKIMVKGFELRVKGEPFSDFKENEDVFLQIDPERFIVVRNKNY